METRYNPYAPGRQEKLVWKKVIAGYYEAKGFNRHSGTVGYYKVYRTHRHGRYTWRATFNGALIVGLWSADAYATARAAKAECHYDAFGQLLDS